MKVWPANLYSLALMEAEFFFIGLPYKQFTNEMVAVMLRPYITVDQVHNSCTLDMFQLVLKPKKRPMEQALFIFFCSLFNRKFKVGIAQCRTGTLIQEGDWVNS